MEERQASILGILDAMGCGGLVLDKAGRVLETNARARRYLGTEFQVTRRNPTPARGTDHPMQEKLRTALRASTEVLPQLGAYIVVPRPNSRPLILRTINPGGADLDSATTALIVIDMEDCLQPDEELLRDVFLLTGAEIRLARRLCCGENLRDIAENLGVTLGTVRVQLKALFVKTGTRRQSELVALLAHLTRLNAG